MLYLYVHIDLPIIWPGAENLSGCSLTARDADTFTAKDIDTAAATTTATNTAGDADSRASNLFLHCQAQAERTD